MNVMLIDPDYEFGKALGLLLEPFGVHLTHIIDTTEGMNVWRNEKDPYDILMIGQYPNDYDLETVVSEIRDNDLNVPIIVLSDGNGLSLLKQLLKRKEINSVGLKELTPTALEDLQSEIYKLYTSWKGS